MGKKSRDPRPISEYALHTSVITLLRFSAKPKVVFFHVPNGEKRSARTGAKLKAMGVLAGVADICIIGPRGLVYFLELKKRGEVPSDAQNAFRDRCVICDAPYRSVDNFEDARSQLISWDLVRPESMNDLVRKFNAAWLPPSSSIREGG